MQREEADQVPEEFIINSEGVIMDPKVLQLAATLQRMRGKAGRAKSHVYSEDRGRYVKYIFPKGKKLHDGCRTQLV